MSVIDPNYDMPFPDYQQTGSFIGPVALPALGPLSGTLVALPCINPDWLRIVLGCVDQLRNPSTWAGLTPSQTVDALGQVEDLRGALQQAGTCVICPEMRLQDCVLQFSCDAGATWTDVSGWADNFANCVNSAVVFPPAPQLRLTDGGTLQQSIDGGTSWTDVTGWTANFCNTALGCLIAPVPPNPGSDTTAQRACNIAGYIAGLLINDVIAKAVTAYNTSLTQLEFGLLIFDVIAFAFPITAVAVDVFAAFYVEFTAMSIADFTAAQSDPVLLADLTCAIYSAIAATGYISAANLASLISNVCAISYVSPTVISALCAFVTNIGLKNLQAMQNVGSLDVVDCTSCGTWCYKWDGSTGNTPPWDFSDNPFSPPPLGQYVPGTGFTPAASPFNQVLMGITFAPTFVTQIEYTTDRGSTNLGAASNIEIVGFATVSFDPPVGLHTGILPINTTCTHIRLDLGSAAGFVLPQNITRVILRGTGTNPFGTTNCS